MVYFKQSDHGTIWHNPGLRVEARLDLYDLVREECKQHELELEMKVKLRPNIFGYSNLFDEEDFKQPRVEDEYTLKRNGEDVLRITRMGLTLDFSSWENNFWLYLLATGIAANIYKNWRKQPNQNHLD